VRDVARDAGVVHRPAPRSRWTRKSRTALARWSMRVCAVTTVVVLRTKASLTAIKEPEPFLLRAYVSPPTVCSAAVRH
jgi:hypothetical protein